MTAWSSDEKIHLLTQLVSDLNRIEDLDILLEEVLRGARATVNADAGSLYLVENHQLHFRYSQNETLERGLAPGEKLLYSIFSLEIDNKSITGYCALTAEPVNIADAYAIPRSAPYRFARQYDLVSRYRTQSILAYPLQTSTGTLVGVLQLINARHPDGTIRTFTKADEEFVGLYAGNATMAVQRAKLARNVIQRMTIMAELRDPRETGPHVNRVAGYAAELYLRWAERRGLNPEEARKTAGTLRMAAMLHDVGKVGISDNILKKPGRLDPDEYAVMKTHTEIGASVFRDPASELDVMAGTLARTHHERWDGGGYPQGLRGEEIPLWGRITAVADVYDALSSHRVYKEAWDEAQVLDELRSQAGRQFDPELVEILLEALPSLKQVSARYPDS